MADYWKSQPRKFCQYCKCWIADNKPSIEFHERGKNHKENVAAKISEIKKKSIDKAKKEERMSKDFAAMEEAAMKAYEEDLKRLEREAAGLPDQVAVQAAAQVTLRPPPLVINQLPKQKQKAAKANKKKMLQREAKLWVQGQSEDGHTYYYNTVTGESKWEKPEGFREETPITESVPSCPWMEAFSPEGYKYYYNSQTGESSWERPADFPTIEPPAPGTSQVEDSWEEPSAPEPEPLPAGDESYDWAQASQEAEAPEALEAPEAPEESSQKPQVPKISFKKRKAVVDPVGKEEEKRDKASGDAPEKVKKKKGTQSAEKQVGVAIRLRKPTAYGSWEQIKEEEDPYSKIDLQLPQVEEITVAAPAELPPEPELKFKERVITSLGDEGGSSAFRKNKTQNGKSRSLRQRDDDD